MENGYCTEFVSGSKVWYKNNKLHRIDGPAIEWSDGGKRWYINGIKYTEEEFNRIMFNNKQIEDIFTI
jgi:hypothetical protein